MPVTIPLWLLELSNRFEQAGYQLFLVGGAIRDQLLSKKVVEWDCATNARPEQTEKILRQANLKNIGTIGKRFGTITAAFNSEPVEITTFRSETYQPHSRQPVVEYGNSIEGDLSRRDFTINAIAYDIQRQKLLDPFGGEQDLRDKSLRAVGKPQERFAEDPLRMLRAIRFMATLNLTIEFETLQAISLERERFTILSGERIAQEFNKILLSEQPSYAIRALVETGLIQHILPELLPAISLEFDPTEHKDIYEHILQVLDNTPSKLALRWCALLHDIAKPLTRQKIGGEYHFLGHEVIGARMAKDILRRLKYPNDFINYVSKLVYLHQRIPNYDGTWADGGVRRFVRDAGETLEDLFIFAKADSTGKNERKLAKYQAMRDELWETIGRLEKEAEIAKIKSPLSGDELMELFHREAGPWLKPIKEQLLAMVLDGQLDQADKKRAAAIAKTLIKNGR